MISEQKINSPELENLANLLPYDQAKFAHKTLLESGKQKTILFAFTAGQELKSHTTPQTALLVMLEGTCLFSMNDKTQPIAAGEVLSIPAAVPHALQAVTNFKMILIK